MFPSESKIHVEKLKMVYLYTSVIIVGVIYFVRKAN